MKRLALLAALTALFAFPIALASSPASAASVLSPAIVDQATADFDQVGKAIEVGKRKGRRHHRYKRRHKGGNDAAKFAIGVGAAILGAAILSGAARKGHARYCHEERVCEPVERCRWRNGYERCYVVDRCWRETVCE